MSHVYCRFGRSVIYLVCSVDVTYIDFIKQHRKYKSTGGSSVEDTAVPPNFNAPDDSRVGRNM
jgi:hypothetical protein